jgi:histone-lysine N-methyltransferase SETMAR
VRASLDTDRRWTCTELSREVGIASSTIHAILTKTLGMRKICARWIPHNLTEVQMWQRMETARLHLDRYAREGEAFLRRIITMDETWARSYEPELKRQSSEWRRQGSPRQRKFRQEAGHVKVMLIVAYDYEGVLLTHAVPSGTTVNAVYYRNFLEHHLCPALRRKRPHLLQSHPIVLHDNARCHVANTVADLFKKWD